MKRDYSTYIGYYIQNIAKVFTHRHNTMLEQIGLTYSQFRVLLYLWEEDGVSQNMLVKDNLMKPASLSGILTTLEKKGYIIRKTATADARCKLVYLTDQGSALEKISFDIINTLEKQVQEVFDAENGLKLVDILQELKTCVDSLDIPDMPVSAKEWMTK